MFLGLLCSITLALDPEVTVHLEPLPFDVAALKADEAAHVSVRVTEKGKSVRYSGVPLRAVLLGPMDGKTPMPKLRSLADAALLVRARDGYQAALSAAEVAMDDTGDRYILALKRDGERLDDTEGPARLIVTSDPEHVRWVRQVSEIVVIRLPKNTPTRVKDSGSPNQQKPRR